jgi:hypothetical protein
MKKLILSLALLLAIAVVPAIAGDFQALNNLSDQEQVALNTMTNEQLAVVEGAQYDGLNLEEIQVNFSSVDDITQTQTAANSSTVTQSNSCSYARCKNSASVFQYISQSQSGVAQANVVND